MTDDCHMGALLLANGCRFNWLTRRFPTPGHERKRQIGPLLLVQLVLFKVSTFHAVSAAPRASVAAFMSGGLTQEEAHAYTEALMGGMNIVAVKADDRERESVEAIFRRLNAGDLEARAGAYETERSVIDRAAPSRRT
jgi:hypothetical protein